MNVMLQVRFAAAAFLAAGLAVSSPSLPQAAGLSDIRIEIGAETARIYAGRLVLAERKQPAPPPETCFIWRGGGRHGQIVCDPGMGPYFGGPYGYRYGYRPPVRRETRTYTGADLALIDLGVGGFADPQDASPPAALQSAPQPFDPSLDQWRLLVKKDGTLDANPAPRVSTAALLRSLAPRREIAQSVAATQDRAIQPVVIRIEGSSREAAIAANQRLLARLGYYGGAADGQLGPQTRDAIARFEVGIGAEPTGRLTARISAAIHRAAGVKETPAGARIAISGFDGAPIEQAPIALTEPLAAGETHVLLLAESEGGERRWQLLSFPPHNAAAAKRAFGIAADRQRQAALDSVGRVALSEEMKERLGALAGPGTVLVIGAAPAPRT
jgi:peptidoglycan hydrolase-like protein with peptidoglycan-binding domain